MKTQYPCNNTKDEIHIWKKNGAFQCALPGTAIESPKNCEVFDCLGYETRQDAVDEAVKYICDHSIKLSYKYKGTV